MLRFFFVKFLNAKIFKVTFFLVQFHAWSLQHMVALLFQNSLMQHERNRGLYTWMALVTFQPASHVVIFGFSSSSEPPVFRDEGLRPAPSLW